MSPIFGGDFFEQNHGLRGCACRADRSASFRGCGINFGGGWGTSNNATTTSTLLADDLAQFFQGSSASSTANSGVARLNQNGPIGGFQFGYNWQFSPLIVVGFEADIQGADISGRGENTGTSTESFAGTSGFAKTLGGRVGRAISIEGVTAAFTNAAISASGFNSVTADLNWLGTVRARLGYLVTPNLLLYATGGLAYGGVSADTSLTTNFNISADSCRRADRGANAADDPAEREKFPSGGRFLA